MAEKKMLVKKGVVVVRDGKRVRPEIGKNFPFSKDEIESINKATPGTLVNPAADEDGEAVAATNSKESGKGAATKAASNAEAAQAGAKGGKKDATANKADGEGGDEKKSDDDL